MNYKRRRLRKAAPRITAAYYRCSTSEQSESGVSLETQAQRCRAYATATGRTIDAEFIDAAESGATLNRPQMQALLARIRKGEIACVIASKLDRYSRCLADVLTLVETCDRHDTELLSAAEAINTGGPAGKMFVNMLASFAEFERGMIGARTSEALAAKRRNRIAYGRVPYGYARKGDRLIADPQQQKALELMRSMRAEGASYQEICDRLTAAGFAPRGTRWFPNSVRQVLQSRMEADAAA